VAVVLKILLSDRGDRMEFTDQLAALSTRAIKQKDIIKT
jgi:hypothetical protein